MELADKVRAAKHIFIIGNGGSYANAMHICNDLLGCGLRAFCLDPSTLTAFANDYGYETAFARWIHICAEKGDLLIALSGSGKSKNILNAIKEAEEKGITVHRVFGREQGLDMQDAEEAQIALGHELMRCLRDRQLRVGVGEEGME